MREVNDRTVRDFNVISTLFPNDFAVVEIVNVDYNIGQQIGIVLGLCDSFGEAWDESCTLEPRDTIVLAGLNRMSVLGGFA
jgi:hypothetical protein